MSVRNASRITESLKQERIGSRMNKCTWLPPSTQQEPPTPAPPPPVTRSENQKQVEMKHKTTERGFQEVEFTDANMYPCSLQQSSAVGTEEGAIQRPGSSMVWLGPFEGRMHLDRDQVAELIALLNSWVKTGSFAEEPPTEPSSPQEFELGQKVKHRASGEVGIVTAIHTQCNKHSVIEHAQIVVAKIKSQKHIFCECDDQPTGIVSVSAGLEKEFEVDAFLLEACS